jgi:hypothetical protein
MRKLPGSLLACVFILAVALLPGCQRSGTSSSEAAAGGATSGTAKHTVTVRRDNPCSVLLPQEVEEITGLSVTLREVVDEETCNFPFDKPSKSPSAQAGATGKAGGEPRLVLKVYWDKGREAILATRVAEKLLGSDSDFEKLSGIGDEAWLGPMASNLTFVKGKTGVELDLRMVPNGRETGIRLAKLIASRL